jgi:hypothetical protein
MAGHEATAARGKRIKERGLRVEADALRRKYVLEN